MNEQALKRIERTTLVLVCCATLVSLLLWDRAVFLGVGLGGGLAALNFLALRRLMAALFRGADGRPQRQAVMGVLLTLKFGVLAGSIFLVIRFLPVDPVALMVGISVVVLSIFVEGLGVVLRAATAPSESE